MEYGKINEYYELVQKAKELISLNSSAEQVIVVETVKANRYYFINLLPVGGQLNGNLVDEKSFVQRLLDKKEQELKYVVCMWNDYNIDVPSMHFRKLLMAASENNADAMLILQSSSGTILKRIGDCMPLTVEIDKTSQYYDFINIEKCDCGYCVNYYTQIKKEYPLLARYLSSLGIDIEKPHETSPIEIHEKGYIEYYPQYVVIGTKPVEFSTKVGDVTITIAESYPCTNVEEEHFVLDVNPVRLKWQN